MKKQSKTGKIAIDIKNMGVDIDKNEYREIVLSAQNHPETAFLKQYKNNKKPEK